MAMVTAEVRSCQHKLLQTLMSHSYNMKGGRLIPKGGRLRDEHIRTPGSINRHYS